MHKILSIAVCFILSTQIFAQNATIKGTIRNAVIGQRIIISPPSYLHSCNYQEKEYPVDGMGNFHIDIELQQPEIIEMILYDTNKHYLVYNLFLSPGDKLNFTAIAGEPASKIKVTGKGAHNNQLLAISNQGFMKWSDTSANKYYGDTLPDRVYSFLADKYQQHQQVLTNYIKQHKPSREFISTWQKNLQYGLAYEYYTFEKENAYKIYSANKQKWDVYNRNESKWISKRPDFFQEDKLSNDAALNVPNYLNLLNTYLDRKKEQSWRESAENREAFILKWYGTDITKGWQEFFEDNDNHFRQRIIEKLFTGKTKEYLYALLVGDILNGNNFKNIGTIYNDFIRQYPASQYRKYLDEPVAKCIRRMQQSLTDKMVFIQGADSLQAFSQLISRFKDKTILLSLWNTWNISSQQQFDLINDSIKQRYGNKNMVLLYVVPVTVARENEYAWKKLIAYYNLEGYHILANQKLSLDIIRKLNADPDEYPPYIIIDKNGNFESASPEYPVDQQKLFKQIDLALLK